MCGIWFNAKVTFLQLCYKEILGESHCCGRMRNEGMKQILPLRVIILYKLLGTSVPPEPWAGGGLQQPLSTAVWQELVWEPGLGACLLCSIQSALSKVTTGFFESQLYMHAQTFAPLAEERGPWYRAGDTMLVYMTAWPDDLRSWTFLHRGTKIGQRRCNGVGVRVWKLSGDLKREGVCFGARQTQFQTDWLAGRPCCAQKRLSRSAPSPLK